MSIETALMRRPFLALIAVALFCHLPSFFIPFLHTDEGVFMAMSRFSFFGDLYSNAIDHKPPFLFQFAWLLSLGGYSTLILHFLAALWCGIGAIAFFSFLKSYVPEKVAFLSALFFSLLIGVINQGALTTERAFLPFITLSLFAANEAIRKPSRAILYSFLAGIFLGAGGCIKQTALIIGGVSVFVLFGTRSRLLNMFCWGLGLLFFTAASWWASGSTFSQVFQEGYLANFSVINVQFDQPGAVHAGGGPLIDFVFVLCWAFLPLTLGTLWGFLRVFRQPKFIRSNAWPLFLLFIAFTGGITALTMSGRYAQNYFLSIFPVLCLITALAIAQKVRVLWIAASLFISLFMMTRTVVMQVSDRNKNWDSQIQQVIDEVKKETSPTDRIWITNAVPSIYFMADRLPAVRTIIMMQMMDYIDLCRADESLIREYPANLNYQRSLQELQEHKPRVIFWVSRRVNTCTDRVKLENFPALQKIISAGYEKAWSNNLGTFYRMKRPPV